MTWVVAWGKRQPWYRRSWPAPCALLAFGLAAIGTAVHLNQDVLWFDTMSPAQATGTVQAVDELDDTTSNSGVATCEEMITYRPPGHAPVTFRSVGLVISGDEKCDRVGDTVTVLYDPRDLGHADTVESLNSERSGVVGGLLLGTSLGLMGLAWLGWIFLRRLVGKST
jgi:hypothetical protein